MQDLQIEDNKINNDNTLFNRPTHKIEINKDAAVAFVKPPFCRAKGCKDLFSLINVKYNYFILE